MAIRRLDFGYTHGWQVEIGRIGHTKFFADRKYHGRRRALSVARKHEATIRNALPVLDDHKNPPRGLSAPLPNNLSTGLCGICDTTQWDHRRGKSYRRIQVHIGPNRNMTLSYNGGPSSSDRRQRLREAKRVRAAAIERWPDFTVEEGRELLGR